MKNKEVAGILYRIADMLEMQNVQFKPAAYRKAARNIEDMAEDIEKVYREGRLEEIPGVGTSISEKIIEILETGHLKYYEKLKKKIPVDLDTLLEIPGIGPKTAKILYEKLKIKTIKDLERAARKHKIQKLPNFGVKSEEDIIHGIERMKSSAGRLLLGHALPTAMTMLEELRKQAFVKKAEIAGSFRRGKETVGDLDFLVVTENPKKVMDFFTSMPEVKEVVAKGPSKSAVVLKIGIDADIRVIVPGEFGSALLYFTGSKEHNIALRKHVMSKGMKLSEYGLFKGKKSIAGKTEEEVYKALGMSWIPPEMRTNEGEIDIALKHKIPRLVRLEDIKGDLQTHTKYSDGSAGIEEMAEATKKLRYEYIAITDHVGSLKIAGAMTKKEIIRQHKEIDSINKKGGKPYVYKGAEVNIDKKGRLDLDTDSLKKMEIVLAAVHSSFKMDSKTMTERLLKAIENRYTRILAHPTTRMIGRRDPVLFNTEKVFQAAKDNGVILEIDAYPDRLDLFDSLIRKAREIGCKFSIDTDTHSVAGLDFMCFGVTMARRGWLEKNDVVNTLDRKALEKILEI